MSEPTSALTFSELILEAAKKARVSSQGSDGLGVAAIPTDVHDLDMCKTIVNDAIRMFLAMGPEPSGWNFRRPVASMGLWPSVAATSANVVTTATYDSSTYTTVTVTSAAFYPSMERKVITFETTGDLTVETYISPTQIKVLGDRSALVGEQFAITADGSYTLPQSFGGEYCGEITYAAGTNNGTVIQWTTEAVSRQWRQGYDSTFGDPYLAAIRVKADTAIQRPRWELIVYPTPESLVTVEFPYTLYFDSLVELTDTPPIPFSHDDTLRAAVRATVEKDIDEMAGVDTTYYNQVALRNSYMINGRTYPGRITRRRGPTSVADFRANFYDRPTVTVNND